MVQRALQHALKTDGGLGVPVVAFGELGNRLGQDLADIMFQRWQVHIAGAEDTDRGRVIQ